MTGNVGLPTLTFGVNGMGQMTSVAASSGQNPASSVTYSDAGSPTNVTFGSGDRIQLYYDVYTNRPTGAYSYVNNVAVHWTGVAWNQNGTVATGYFNDLADTSRYHTCNYAYDDLARLSRSYCQFSGSAYPAYAWQQNFSYDAAGNITKTVPQGGTGGSFQPTYSLATNRITSLPGVTITYDANGNMTNDGTYMYQWDAEGKATAVDTATVTYDALGRAAEVLNGSAYTQFVYDVGGSKLAKMNGMALVQAWVGLPGGATAIYNASGLAYYRHPDWLGSSRLASTPSRTIYSKTAYAPFGETFLESGTQDRSFTGKDQDTKQGIYDFPARRYSPGQGRWLSPDPSGLGAMHLDHPQSLNRYAYVMNSPCNAVDPMGLDAEIWDPTPWSVTVNATMMQLGLFGSAFASGIGVFAGGRQIDADTGPARRRGDGDQHDRAWDKQWGATMPCQKSAQEVMAALQKDFSQLASFNEPPLYANFTGNIVEGGTVKIAAGVSVPIAPGLPGIPVPSPTVTVNVSSVTPNAFTFTDTSDHFLYPGYVQFSSTQVGADVQFMVQAHGDWNGGWGYINGLLKEGEAATWNHLTNQIREICK